jgi:cytochrome c-type biogenesis protein CcmH/NrfG
MSTESLCPSCGRPNPSEAARCGNCNFPLREGPAPPRAERASEPAPAPPGATKPAFDPSIPRLRPIRPRRPAGPDQLLKTQLYIGLGVLAVVLVLWTAFQGFKKNNPAPAVEGAREDQQQAANMARAELARDSSNVNAQVALANVLYDTANWSEAIVHYRSAQRLDPTRVTTIVDMGVCYYNLGDAATAEGLFKRALELDPSQPVALFNLGIVAESRNDFEGALKFYHAAVRSNPPAGMSDALNESLKRVQGKLGKTPPPLAPSPGGTSAR